ncbi:hypothetical protein ACFVAJ_17390 [Agromyces sp. NPDC057679]|uniref:hypothetical protein n=1 Tax=Agromyces sp. NPDC057679 TaxID=3346207 RepID=UPI0036720F26
MKKTVYAAIVALSLTAVLTGCGKMSIETMKELAEARDTCNELGGRFSHYDDELGNQYWDCNFDDAN